MKIKITPKKPAPKAPVPVTVKKCQALEIGHRSCQCGSPDCGANIGRKAK